MTPSLLAPSHWQDYELVDSGGYEKLERFGRYLVARPEPQAVWNKSLSPGEWEKLADATFRRDKKSDERGEWTTKPGMPGQWSVGYRYGGMSLKMRLGLTSFKHVGIFPEQAVNWDYIYDRVKLCGPSPKVLNLFAYTGGASLAARAAGAEVTHVDSVKQVVSWSRENMEASGLADIRWIVDDAMKFVRREVKRGNSYNGLILDPPAYGRGPDGEKWVLEENINELLALCSELLLEHNAFLVLNLYSMGLSALLARTAIDQAFGSVPSSDEEFGELYLTDRAGKNLPLGVFYRMFR